MDWGRGAALLWLAWAGWLGFTTGESVATAAEPAPPSFGDSATVISQSGQFLVMGPRSARRVVMESRRPGESLRELSPQTLAVSCERVKAGILEALELTDQWRKGGGRTGKIFVGIDANLRTNVPLAVEATVFEQGWQFRLAVPPRVTEDRLVRGLVQAVTVELGSRAGTARPGEPPLWLVEGLTQMLLSGAPEGLILQPETRATVDVRADETLKRVRELLSRRTAMAFHQLSQPELDTMDERGWEVYGASAHLCCRELLRLPEGRARMGRWIAGLQDRWNWQTGFVDAFQPQFRSLLDVEKWWALVVANFVGRNAASTWTSAFALRKLDDALHPLGVTGSGRGKAARLPIEDVMTTWDFARQVPLLRQILQQLQAIRINAPAAVSVLVFRYSDVLDDYLAARSRAGYSPVSRGQGPSSVKVILREAVGRLRELDGDREKLATAPEEPRK